MHDEYQAINVRLAPAEKAAVNAWRRQQEDPPSLSRAARELIRIGLSVQEPSHV